MSEKLKIYAQAEVDAKIAAMLERAILLVCPYCKLGNPFTNKRKLTHIVRVQHEKTLNVTNEWCEGRDIRKLIPRQGGSTAKPASVAPSQHGG